MSDENETTNVVQLPPAGPAGLTPSQTPAEQSVQEALAAEYRDLVAQYGDAVYRLKGLTEYVTAAEARIRTFEARNAPRQG